MQEVLLGENLPEIQTLFYEQNQKHTYITNLLSAEFAQQVLIGKEEEHLMIILEFFSLCKSIYMYCEYSLETSQYIF